MISSEFGIWETDRYMVNNFYLSLQDDKIFVRRINPKNCEKKATIVIVHGFAQHSGHFLNVAQHFLSQSFEVLMLDNKGFGLSGAGRVYTTVQELERCVVKVMGEADILKPIILFGHSLGGLIVTSILIDYPEIKISAVIVEAPFLGMPEGRALPWHKRLIVKYLGNSLHPFMLNSMLNLTSVTKNNHHIKRLVDDQLVFPFLNLPMIQSMIVSIEKVHANAHYITIPYMIVIGVKDTITPYRDSVNFIKRISSIQKKLVAFPNGYHQLHNQQEKQSMYVEIGNWLQEVDLQPLGHIDDTRRVFKRNLSRLQRGVIIFLLSVLGLIIAYKSPCFREKQWIPIRTLLVPIISTLQRLRIA